MEKSLQRIQQGARNPMYTTVQSIDNKVGSVPGWKELLQAVGFRFEPATAGLPPAVFFPQSDPSDRLTQASSSLQALLGKGVCVSVCLSVCACVSVPVCVLRGVYVCVVWVFCACVWVDRCACPCVWGGGVSVLVWEGGGV